MIEREVEIKTADGVMKTFLYHPEQDGPHPIVLYMMDAPSIRPVLKDMASRLASAGYYVMLPYLYYRRGPYREFGMSDEDMHARRELMGSVTKTGAVEDAKALLAFAADDAMARRGPVGAVGFCMSGPLVVAIANALPDRIAAAAALHGAYYVTEKPDSTHRNLAKIRGELYFGWPDKDATAPISDLKTLSAALDAAKVKHTIDFFEGALHGFAPAGGARYHRYASERHWERVHALFRRALA